MVGAVAVAATGLPPKRTLAAGLPFSLRERLYWRVETGQIVGLFLLQRQGLPEQKTALTSLGDRGAWGGMGVRVPLVATFWVYG